MAMRSLAALSLASMARLSPRPLRTSGTNTPFTPPQPFQYQLAWITTMATLRMLAYALRDFGYLQGLVMHLIGDHQLLKGIQALGSELS
jgi:hypothetical protein